MSNHLGNFFHQDRLKQGLTLGQLARLVGYRNVSKGANKIICFEREGTVTEELLVALAEALDIDLPTVKRLIEQDRQDCLREWEAWVSQPVPMQLIVRYMPAVYGRVPLPPETTTPEQALDYARHFAREHRWKVCLAVSRRLSIWIGKDGDIESRTEATPDSTNAPFMRLKGSSRKFLFGFDKSGEQE